MARRSHSTPPATERSRRTAQCGVLCRPLGVERIAGDDDPEPPQQLVRLWAFLRHAALDEVQVDEAHRVERREVDELETGSNVRVEGVVQQDHRLPRARRAEEVKDVATHASGAVIPVDEHKVDGLARQLQLPQEEREELMAAPMWNSTFGNRSSVTAGWDARSNECTFALCALMLPASPRIRSDLDREVRLDETSAARSPGNINQSSRRRSRRAPTA